MQDILLAVAYAHDRGADKVHLVGFDKAGPWAVLARALCGDVVARTAADLNRFRFDKVTDPADPMMLPGAVKYGGRLTAIHESAGALRAFLRAK